MGSPVVLRCDLRVAFGPARNQGDRPTCVAFALSDAHSAARGTLTTMSPEHLYFHAVQRTSGGHPDDGVPLVPACDALKFDGQAAETGWPYLNALPLDLTLWKPPPSAVPLFLHGSEAASENIAEVTSRLDAGQPVVLILLLGERFYEPLDGIVSLGPDDADVGYHAVIAVGHGQSAAGEECILIRNSWGVDWAFDGHAWITAPYLAARLTDTLVMEIGGSP
jgi:hypothetical protein